MSAAAWACYAAAWQLCQGCNNRSNFKPSEVLGVPALHRKQRSAAGKSDSQPADVPKDTLWRFLPAQAGGAASAVCTSQVPSLPTLCPQVADPSRTTATSKAARYLQKRGSLLQSAASTQEGLSVLATNGLELSPRDTLRRREHVAEQGKPPWQISIKTEQPFRVERPGSGTRRSINQSVPAVTGGPSQDEAGHAVINRR